MSTTHEQRARDLERRRMRENYATELQVMVKIGDEHFIVSQQVAAMRRTRRWQRNVRRYSTLAWPGR